MPHSCQMRHRIHTPCCGVLVADNALAARSRTEPQRFRKQGPPCLGIKKHAYRGLEQIGLVLLGDYRHPPAIEAYQCADRIDADAAHECLHQLCVEMKAAPFENLAHRFRWRHALVITTVR